MQRQIIVSVFLWSPIWSRGDPQLEEDDPDDPDDSDDPDDLDDVMIWPLDQTNLQSIISAMTAVF